MYVLCSAIYDFGNLCVECRMYREIGGLNLKYSNL
jgi:hypothetical protein